jgi:hypothetical protein
VIFVQSVGGLGNQLFQLAFSHHLLEIYPNEKVTIFWDKYHDSKRNYELDKLLLDCTHMISFRRNNRLGLLLKIIDKINRHNSKFYKRISIALNIKSENSTAFDFSKKGKIYRGFFQMPQDMRNAIFQTASELDRSLEKSNFTVPVNSRYTAIHLRRSDFQENKDTIGVLQTSYYRNILIKNQNVVIATDSLPIPKEMETFFKNTLTLDPKEYDTFHTIFLISRGSEVFIANSTFSWWAGVIAQMRKIPVYAPSPWTKKVMKDANLNWDQFKYLDAIYE